MTEPSRFARDVETALGALRHVDVTRVATVDHHGRTWPIYCVLSRRLQPDRPTMLISGGVHGDEPAGVYAALAFLADGEREFRDDLQFVVFPCVNPSGFDAGTLETAAGANLNRLFGLGSSEPEIRAVEDWLERRALRFRMTFDLHEVTPDYVGEGYTQRDNPHEAYLYETVCDGSERVGRAMLEALPADRPICQWPAIYHDVNDRGLISYPQDRRNRIYAQGTTLDSFLVDRYTGHSFTLETPTGWPLETRADTQLRLVTTALRHAVWHPHSGVLS